jgi:hypothetical protein|tara:strand:- start:267 stop:863 length:597 start_codon:yes stop_codon:yes gene_type:complete
MTVDNAVSRIRNIIESETTAYFSSDELKEFIKMGVDEFIQQYYMAFENTQDSRDKLQDLVINADQAFIDGTAVDIGGMDGAVSGLEYGRFLSAYVKATPNVNVKVVQISDISAYLNDPFNKADASNPVLYFKGGNIHSIGLTASTVVVVTYLQYTTDILKLNATTHEEVCQIAARKVLATLGDPRYQMIQAELTERRV